MPLTRIRDAESLRRVEISVIVCTRNRAASLDRTLEALSKQALPPDVAWEVVVVDNGSTDATASVVCSWEKRYPALIRGVTEPTPGLSSARNRGIVAAHGGILAFTDDDALPADDWIASITQAFASGGADIVGGRILPHWAVTPPRWLLTNRYLLQQLSLIDRETKGLVDYTSDLRVWGSNLAMRRSVFDDVGTFDTSFGRCDAKLYSGEDTDLIRRACASGKRVVYDPGLVVHHCIEEDRMTRRYFRKRAFDDGRQLGMQQSQWTRAFFPIPGVVYRSALLSAARVLLAASMPKRRFPRELKFIHQVGLAVGYLTGRNREVPRNLAP